MMMNWFDFFPVKRFLGNMMWIYAFVFVSIVFKSSVATTATNGYFWIEDLSSKGTITTLPPIWNEKSSGIGACAMKCFSDVDCESFFYSNDTSMCKGHSNSYWTYGSFQASEGVAYYKAMCKDPDFRFIRKFGTCYKVVENDKKSWYDAEAYCQEHNGWLITLEQTGRFEHFAIDMKSEYTSGEIWVGLTDLVSNYVWIWNHTGTVEKKVKKRWHNGQPDDDNGGQSCVQLYLYLVNLSLKMKYDDAKCEALKSFICECPLA